MDRGEGWWVEAVVADVVIDYAGFGDFVAWGIAVDYYPWQEAAVDRVAFDQCVGYGCVGPVGGDDYLADKGPVSGACSEDCVV